MTRILSIISLIILILLIGIVSWCAPELISDDNSFLEGFVNHELLAFLGIIVTITLASAANLHLELNRLEDSTGEQFDEARSATRAYAYLLIGLFAFGLLLVVLKPILSFSEHWEAGLNGAAIVIIALNILALMDLTGAVFRIPADRRLGDDNPS